MLVVWKRNNLQKHVEQRQKSGKSFLYCWSYICDASFIVTIGHSSWYSGHFCTKGQHENQRSGRSIWKPTQISFPSLMVQLYKKRICEVQFDRHCRDDWRRFSDQGGPTILLSCHQTESSQIWGFGGFRYSVACSVKNSDLLYFAGKVGCQHQWEPLGEHSLHQMLPHSAKQNFWLHQELAMQNDPLN